MPGQDSMLDELLKSTPGAPTTPGIDPLSTIVPDTPVSVPDTPVLPSVPEGVPGSAGAVSFVDQLAATVSQPEPSVQSATMPPSAVSVVPPTVVSVPATPPVSDSLPSPEQANSLASIPGIVLQGTDGAGVPSDGNSPTPPPPKKKKEPMRPIDFLKIVWALFVVSLIFFGSFFAYIVFNPEEAKLFIQFGINRADIQSLLALLVNSTFGTITFSLSIVWIIYLFKMILTKKEYKRKKTVATILAVFFGVLLFSNITFWAFLIQKIGAQDFANPNGGVKIYDNDRFLSEQFKNSSEIEDFNNIIGPTTLKYDLVSDVGYVRKKYMSIDSFEIDFDGDGTVDKEGADPAEANDLIFTYSKKGKYTPKGRYFGKDNITGEPKTRAMELPVVNVSAVIVITKTKKGIVFDAKDAMQLGTPRWYESSDLNKPASVNAVYTASLLKEERFLCLALITNKTKNENCNKIFVIRPEGEDPIEATIKTERVLDDRLTYRFSLENVKVKTGGDIATYRWVMENGSVFCQKESCEYMFTEYGKQRFTVTLTDAANNTVEIPGELDIKRPLNLDSSTGGDPLLKVADDSWKSLLTSSAYDRGGGLYRVSDLPIPSKLKFDANDVRVKNSGFELESVEWTFGKDGPKKVGLQVEHEFVKEGRFEVTVKYAFKNFSTEDRGEVVEKIVFIGKKSSLVANVVITSPDSDDENYYAPTTIKFDGSASRTQEWTISKFIYDFGLPGRVPAEGDAIQTIRYDNAGEYQISLTVVKDDGSKDTVTRKIVIKDIPKSLKVNSSVSSGIVGSGVDFDVSGSSGQIETYVWNFWDGSVPSIEPNPTHVFERPGTFTVTLEAKYADQTVKTVEKDIVIKAASD